MRNGKKTSLFLVVLVATTFVWNPIGIAELVPARPIPPAPIPPRPVPPKPTPAPVPPRPVPPKPVPPAPIPPRPNPGRPGTIDPKPAQRLGSHTGVSGASGRELAPTKLSHEQVLERLQSKALKEQVKDSPEALDGLAVREGLLETALNGQKELNHLSAGKLEKALMERLLGKDLSKMKEQDLKDLQSLVCAPMCGGHEGMALSCRRVTRLLEALKSTPGILASSAALGTVFAAFVDAQTEKVGKSEGIVVADGEGSTVKVTELDKPVTQEKLVPEPEQSK